MNIFQIFIVVIAALITYKIFILGEPEIHRFVRKVRKAFEDKEKPDKEHSNDIEAVGVITGNAFNALINVADSTSEQEQKIRHFVKKVRKAFEDKEKPDKSCPDDLEAVGVITGNALDALISHPERCRRATLNS